MNKNDYQCPLCGENDLVKKGITETFEYKGQKFKYPNYVVYECSKCKEAIVDKKTLKESGRAIRDFYRKVDGLLTASEIHRIRTTRLYLTQDKASELLGGGAKSFARYENSEVIQSVALNNLLRILDDDPGKLSVIVGKKVEQKDSIVIVLPTKYNYKQIVEMQTGKNDEYYDTDLVECYG